MQITHLYEKASHFTNECTIVDCSHSGSSNLKICFRYIINSTAALVLLREQSRVYLYTAACYSKTFQYNKCGPYN